MANERFTDRARKVMQLANKEAIRFNHEYIGTEHILLGLIGEGAGVAANVFKNLDIDLRKVRIEIEKIVMAGPDLVTLGKLPQTPRAKKVIEYAIEEARNLNHDYVGTEHVLLGLLREGEGVAGEILMNLGLMLEDVREEVLNLLGHNIDSSQVGSRRGGIPAGQDLSTALVHIPDSVIQVLAQINGRIEKLAQEKEKAVSEQDFQKAAQLRDKEDMIKRDLLKVIKKLEAVARESEDDAE
jgi:ATP-dependent Clp protease ATP-binding subunit ClpA